MALDVISYLMGASAGRSSGDVNFLYGFEEPSAGAGSVGDAYVQYSSLFTGRSVTINIKIDSAKRGNSALYYASAMEIKVIVEDPSGNEIDMRDLPGFSVRCIASSPGTPANAFDNNLETMWEASTTPLTLAVTATVPANSVFKRLEVYQRTGSYNTDVWSTFSVYPATDPDAILASYSNLASTDWAGAGNWTIFPATATPNLIKIVDVFVKTETGWEPFEEWVPT